MPTYGAAFDGTKPALIQRGRVYAVDVRNYTVDIISEYTYAITPDVPFASPYAHYSNGEGINFMPEVGATCWYCKTSDNQVFVLGFTPPTEEGGFRGGRPLLSPGDIHLSTRNGNFVTLKRGGVVQVGSNAICQRVYFPIKNIIRDFAENYELHTFGGDLIWSVDRQENDSDGHRMSSFVVKVKEFADDPNDDPIALLKIGSHGDSDKTILTLETRDKGAGKVKVSLTFDKDGNVNWNLEKKLTLNAKGDISVETNGALDLKAKNTISIQSASAKMELKAVGIDIKSSANLTLSSNAITSIKGTLVKLNAGGVPYPVVRLSPDFIAWIGGVTAAINALPVPPTPPLVPPVQHMNPKVLT